MSKILEELLSAIPAVASFPDRQDEGKVLEIKAPKEIKLNELPAIQAAYFQLSNLIQNFYGALIYAGIECNADNLLPMMNEFLPEDKAILKTMKNKAAFLFEFYNNKGTGGEKAYYSLTLLNAIINKYKVNTSFQKELDKLQQELVKADENKAVLKELQKQKSHLEKMDLACRQLKLVLEEKGKHIEEEIELALEPQKMERKKIEERIMQLIEKEKSQLIATMVALQKQVLNQAEYKLKNSIFFRQGRLDKSNAMSALLAEANSKLAFFENQELSFTQLLLELNLLYKKTVATKATSSKQEAKNAAELNPEFYAAAAPILLTLYNNLLKLKEEVCKLEEKLGAFNESLEEIEKSLRLNKIKRALRNLEQAAANNEVNPPAFATPAIKKTEAPPAAEQFKFQCCP